MSPITPESFEMSKQRATDYRCGYHSLKMLLQNFETENPPSLRVVSGEVSRTWGILTKRLEELCCAGQMLECLGLQLVEGQDLTLYQYGIAMVAFLEKAELWTHYVVFFAHDGEVYIADPHPDRPPKPTKLDKEKFTESWMTKKDDPRWATKPTEQAEYWPRPGWALGRLLGA